MESIIISPQTKDEARFIVEMLERMHIHSRTITEEEKEDLGLLMIMKDVDRNETVSREEVMNKLRT